MCRIIGTYICVLSVDAGGGDDPRLLLVLVENKGIRIDVALDDLETAFVGNACSCIWDSRHNIEAQRGMGARAGQAEKLLGATGDEPRLGWFKKSKSSSRISHNFFINFIFARSVMQGFKCVLMPFY